MGTAAIIKGHGIYFSKSLFQVTENISLMEEYRMHRKYKLFMPLLAMSILFLNGCGNTSLNENAESTHVPGAIVFEAQDMEGNVVSSEIFSETKLTMINVWATY